MALLTIVLYKDSCMLQENCSAPDLCCYVASNIAAAPRFSIWVIWVYVGWYTLSQLHDDQGKS